MLKRLCFLGLIALATGPAQAAFPFFVWADGHTDGIAGTADYNQYIENVVTFVSGDKALNIGNGSQAALGSFASLGVLKAYAKLDTPNFNLQGDTSAWARGQYQDVINVGGSAPVTLKFSLPTTGTFTPGSYDALGSASLEVRTTSTELLYLSYQERLFQGVSTVWQNNTIGQVTVDPGTQIILSGYLVTSVRVVPANSIALVSGADFSHTSQTFIEVLTPGGSITALSGQIYAPVPEPETYAMMLAGLGLVGAISLRRKAKQTS